MKKQVVFLLILLFSLNNIFASMAVSDYESAVDVSDSELYVSDPLGVDVKTSPSEYAETIIHLPVNTQVRLMSMHGPANVVVKDEENWHATWESNWVAIYLPTGTGYENQIGWIYTADELWWSPREFSTSKWGPRDLKSYLMSSVWEMEYRINGKINKRAIITFNEYSIDGYEVFQNGCARLRLGYYDVNSGSTLQILECTDISNGNKRLSIQERCFSYEEQYGTYFYKKVNLGSIDYMDIFKEVGKESFAIGLMYNDSRWYFRMYGRDYYNNKNIAEYAVEQGLYKNSLMAVAISYGVCADNYPYKLQMGKYWDPYITECENNIKRNNYSFNKIIKEADFFCIDKLYYTNDRLKLRKTPDLTGDVITVMDNHVYVVVTDYGKMEKIDGILSIWVKVEICEKAVDGSGNPIPKGTTGWCFGAYISDAG